MIDSHIRKRHRALGPLVHLHLGFRHVQPLNAFRFQDFYCVIDKPMINFFLIIGTVALAFQAFIGLSFFISCLWEKERRASVFALLQFLGMLLVLVVYLLLIKVGFFYGKTGIGILIAGYALSIIAAVLMIHRTAPNPKTLMGTSGYIVGEVKRQDEREIVFARNRSQKPGSAI